MIKLTKRNLLMLTFMSFISFHAMGQSTSDVFNIQGKLEDLNFYYAFLTYWDDNKEFKDSVLIKDGTFQFKGKIQHPSPAEIYFKENKFIAPLRFYIDKSSMTITGNIDSLDLARVTGSKSQDEFVELKNFNNEIRAKKDVLYAADSHNENPEIKKRQIDSLSNIERHNTLTFITNHPKSVVSLNALMNLTESLPIDEVSNIYNKLDTGLKSTATGYIVGHFIENKLNTDIGSIAPIFVAKDTSGKAISLADFKGKYVLIDFWASWCKPCRAENPNVLNAYEKYKNKGFTVIGFSLDDKENLEAWKMAIQKDHLVFPQVSDLEGGSSPIALKYAIDAIPMNYLLDKNGKIIAKNLRQEALQSKLSELLN